MAKRRSRMNRLGVADGFRELSLAKIVDRAKKIRCLFKSMVGLVV